MGTTLGTKHQGDSGIRSRMCILGIMGRGRVMGIVVILGIMGKTYDA